MPFFPLKLDLLALLFPCHQPIKGQNGDFAGSLGPQADCPNLLGLGGYSLQQRTQALLTLGALMRLLLHRGGGTLRRQTVTPGKGDSRNKDLEGGFESVWRPCLGVGHEGWLQISGLPGTGDCQSRRMCVFWIRVNGETFKVISHRKALGHGSNPQPEAYHLSASLESWAMVHTLRLL